MTDGASYVYVVGKVIQQDIIVVIDKSRKVVKSDVVKRGEGLSIIAPVPAPPVLHQ